MSSSNEVFPVIYRVEGLQPQKLSAVRFHGERRGGDLSHVVPPSDYERCGRSKPHVYLFDKNGKELTFSDAMKLDWVQSIRNEISAAAAFNTREQVQNLTLRGSKRARRREREGNKLPYRTQGTNGPLREIFLGARAEFFQEPATPSGTWNKRKLRQFIALGVAFLRREWGPSLRYIRVDLDESSPHIHAVAAPWVEFETRTGAKQRMLSPTRVENYCTEQAQNRVAEAMQPLGLSRGRKISEARRIAKEHGLLGPKKPKHQRPAKWRREKAAEKQLVATEVLEAKQRGGGLACPNDQSISPKIEVEQRLLVQDEGDLLTCIRAKEKNRAIDLAKVAKAERDARQRKKEAIAKAARKKMVSERIKKQKQRSKVRGR